MKNLKSQLQIFLLLFILSASVLFVSGCLSSTDSNNYDSVEMKSFVSEEEMKEYFQTFYNPGNGSGQQYSSSYSGRFWQTESGAIVFPPGPVAAIAAPTSSVGSARTVGVGESDYVKTDGQTIYYTPNNYYPYHFVESENSSSVNNSSKQYTYDAEKRTFVIDVFPSADTSFLSQLNMSGDLYLINDTLITIHYNLITGYNVSDPANPKEIWKKSFGGYHMTSHVIDDKLYIAVQNQTVLFPMEYMGESISPKNIYYPASLDLRHPETRNIYYISEVDVQSGNFDKTIALLGISGSVVFGSDQFLYLTSNYITVDDVLYLDFVKQFGSTFYPNDIMKEVDEISESGNLSFSVKAQNIRKILSDYSSTLSSEEQSTLSQRVRNTYYVYESDVYNSTNQTIISQINLKTFDIKTKSVSGAISNSFSINEYEGYLRVAAIYPSNQMIRDKIYSSVHVFDENMDVVGSLTGLPQGDRISGFRFVGDKLYLVTYKSDPFSVIDLSDPKNPTALGRLKISGYPTYLNLINETAVIGLGKTDNDSMKLTLYDITNVSNPIEKDSYVFNRSFSSVVSSNYPAFLWNADKNLLVIPTSGHTYIFSVSDGKISLVLDDVHEKSTVIRTIYINDYLYTFSNREVHILDQNTWERVKVIDIPQPDFNPF